MKWIIYNRMEKDTKDNKKALYIVELFLLVSKDFSYMILEYILRSGEKKYCV